MFFENIKYLLYLTLIPQNYVFRNISFGLAPQMGNRHQASVMIIQEAIFHQRLFYSSRIKKHYKHLKNQEYLFFSYNIIRQSHQYTIFV